MIITVTGHRPDKLGGYKKEARMRVEQFASEVIGACRPTRLLIGMAIGFDMAMAKAALSWSVPFEAFIPCEGQEKLWSEEDQSDYRYLLVKAAKCHVTHTGKYYPGVMQIRNRVMVDAGAGVLALWDGGMTGGTANCLEYAIRKQRVILNCWSRWVGFIKDKPL